MSIDYNDRLTLAIISDPHLFSKTPPDSDLDAYQQYQNCRMFWDTQERFAAAAKEVNSCSPDIVLITGDIIDHVSDANIRLYMEIRHLLSGEIYPVAGNHDHATLTVGRGQDGEMDPHWDMIEPDADRKPAPGVFPNDAFDYSFVRGGFKFIAVDNGRYSLTPEQLSWLEGELKSAPDAAVFVYNHVPLKTPATMDTLHRIWGDNESLVIPHSDPQFEMLMAYRSKIACIFSGHLHSFSDDTVQGLRQVVCPITAQAPNGFLLYELNAQSGGFQLVEHS